MMRFVEPKGFCGVARVALLAAALAAAAAAVARRAVAEDNQAPPGAAGAVQPAPPAPAAPAPVIPPQPTPARPGFLHQMKVWWDQSVTFFDAKIKGTPGTVEDLNNKAGVAAKSAAAGAQEAMKSAVDATKDAAAATQDVMNNALEASKGAATTIIRLPNTRVVEVHERCEQAPNGGPDCAKAAANACRGKGFVAGRALEVRTAEQCDTTLAWQPGQSPGHGECPIESWVARAVCQ
jgi:hypothetical protein